VIHFVQPWGITPGARFQQAAENPNTTTPDRPQGLSHRAESTACDEDLTGVNLSATFFSSLPELGCSSVPGFPHLWQ